MRKAEVTRKTRETEVRAAVNLDGEGHSRDPTGIGFLDHMLEQLARHGLLRPRGRGRRATCTSTSTTPPRTPASSSARRWPRRWAAAPASAATARLYPDGRDPDPRSPSTLQPALPDLEGDLHQAEAGRDGHRAVQGMVPGLRAAAGCTLHVENLYGENNHHIVESCFKGLARALRAAVEIDPRQTGRGALDQGRAVGRSSMR